MSAQDLLNVPQGPLIPSDFLASSAVFTEQVQVKGNMTVGSPGNNNTLTVFGDFDVSGDFDVDDLNAMGSVTVGGTVTTDSLSVSTSLGFFGTTPVVQQSAPAPAATQTAGYVQADVQSIADAVNGVITALQAYGLLN